MENRGRDTAYTETDGDYLGRVREGGVKEGRDIIWGGKSFRIIDMESA